MQKLLFLFAMLLHFNVFGQPTPVEVMVGNRNYWYQHTFNHQVEQTRFGFFNVSSIHAFYDNTQDELMSQSYLTYKLREGIKVGGGTFYASVPGVSPSLHLQLSYKYRNLSLLVIPRTDISVSNKQDIMMQIECKPNLAINKTLYIRFQTMLSLKDGIHSRSYQNIRLGFSLREIQLGVAGNFDAYGTQKKYHSNFGVFIKKNIF